MAGEAQKGTQVPGTLRGGGELRVTRTVLVVVGGIAAFLGLFILLGGDDQSIGIGGAVSWRVGDIDPAWGVGLLIGGVLFALVGVLVIIGARSADGAGARPASTPRADLIAHAVVFVLVNAFLWVQDIAIGDGLNYALWVTIPWGVGLAVHAIAYGASARR
jgi:hypothetical protein